MSVNLEMLFHMVGPARRNAYQQQPWKDYSRPPWFGRSASMARLAIGAAIETGGNVRMGE
jgi:hypothetical protein